jgi:hypothetical protein
MLQCAEPPHPKLVIEAASPESKLPPCSPDVSVCGKAKWEFLITLFAVENVLAEAYNLHPQGRNQGGGSSVSHQPRARLCTAIGRTFV